VRRLKAPRARGRTQAEAQMLRYARDASAVPAAYLGARGRQNDKTQELLVRWCVG
jgi:hypothetical protein